MKNRDDYDDEPRRGRSRNKKAARKRDEDYDDRDDEEPARKSSSGPLLLVIGGGVGLVLLLAVGGGLLAYFKVHSSKATEASPRSDFVMQNRPPVETKPETPAPPPPTIPEKPKETPPSAPPPPPPIVPVAKPPEQKPVAKFNKLPVPDEAAQARAEKEIKTKYKDDYAKTKPEERLALAAKFLQPGRENREDSAQWFVILREARDISMEVQRPRLVVEAVNEIDRWFIIDAQDMKLKLLTTLSQSTVDSVVVATGLTALSQVKQALADDNYDAALRFVDLAEAAGRKIKSPKTTAKSDDKPKSEDNLVPEDDKRPETKLLTLIKTRKAEVEGYKKDYEAVAAAKTKLKDKPDDPEANLAVGQHLCYFHGRWDEGLPMLAKCSDQILQDLAKKDLAQPVDPAVQAAVGNDWYNLGILKPERSKLNAYDRAMYWYEPAEAKAAGDVKEKITKQIKLIRDKAAEHIPRLLPGSYYGRNTEDRVLLLREGGGTARSEEAVERGLEWLSLHQAPDGGWYTDTFQTSGKCECGDQGEKHDIAGTAFGLLPFLGAGEVHAGSKYARNVTRGLEYLRRKQNKEKGNFSDNAYENALATIAFCEAFGLTRDPRLKSSAQAAVNFIVGAQYSDGSWGYTAGTKGDLSVTGWQFSALKTAYYARLSVPESSFRNVARFLDSVADPSGLGYGYNAPSTARATSATGLLCREYLGWTARRPELTKGMNQLALNTVTADAPSIYFLFYATQAMHHFGGKTWETWNPKTRDLLLELQDIGKTPGRSHQKGSWSPYGDEYAKQGGRLMFTSLSLLTLEVYYYSVPLNGYGAAVLLE
jgi:hypothetical protein